jgi:hypothetical protein
MRKLQGAVLSIVAVALGSSAGAVTITFDEPGVGLVHGSVISTQYAGLTIGTDVGGGARPTVAFDSGTTNSLDPDLEFGTGWSSGNLSNPQVQLGNLLIINEFISGCGDGICDIPADEGDGGTLIFDFDIPVLSFGFDLIDIEGPGKSSELSGAITFFDTSAGISVEISMMTFLAGFDVGNHSANRVPAFTATALGLGQIDRVDLFLGGSGAVDNLVFDPVPEPTTAGLVGVGLAALAARSRARRR